ncbi:MAG: hypothetical protein Q8L21_01235, partial [Candidatus Komeilibacteria bacterium]|nr:hypothetical protein [Candidatus Komeilibacteria bacterium]
MASKKTKLLIYLIAISSLAISLFSSGQLARAADPVSNVQAVAEANVQRIIITWAAPVGGDGFYRIYRSTSSSSNGTILVNELSNLTYTDAAVVYNTTYYYRVAALSGGVESALSSAVSAKPILPKPVSVIAVDTGQGKEIKISWERPTLEVPLKYKVYRSTSESSAGSSLTSNLDGTEYFDKTATNGVSYYYRVKSVYGTSTESDQSAVVLATATDAVAPARPTNVRVSISSSRRATVNWTAPANE